MKDQNGDEILKMWRELALRFAQRSFKIVVSTKECHIPLTEWDAFRDAVRDLVEQERKGVKDE